MMIEYTPLKHTGNHGIVQLVNDVFAYAIQSTASDIHCEPTADKKLRIRLRADGVLHEAITIPANQTQAVISRIKVLSNLDIAEQRLPQDGRFKIDNTIDCRVSSCPTLFGEKIVVRLLNVGQQQLQLNDVGFDESLLAEVKHAIYQPQGLVLVTGPTGSGKTRTLYALLSEINSESKNIMTIEDPVEIQLAGINQVAVNTKAGLTFATALRSFLRQDPDVIMVGEIRDIDTADIAVKAAQTGHLVLATVHTNSGKQTIDRLVNMGVAPYLIEHSLQLVINQRLIRKLCPHCKKEAPDAKAQLKRYHIAAEIFYKPVGCEHCHQGYCGRVAIFDSPSLWEQGCEKLKAGVTSLSELLRVVGHEAV